jgi:hypothetical protein
MIKTVYIQHKQNNTLTNAYSVTLANSTGTFGIKTTNGSVIVASGTATDNPSTGIYEYTGEFSENTIYIISWAIKETSASSVNYVQQQLGPFDSGSIRSSSDFRGTFVQGTNSTVFLKITDFDGNAVDASDITCTITNTDSSEVAATGEPEKITTGFYAFDWAIPADQTLGEYGVLWTFNADGNKTESQSIIVAAANDSTALYALRIIEMRHSLDLMLNRVQAIPVYQEPPIKLSSTKVKLTFGNLNQTPGVRVYLNSNLITSGYSVNYFKGTIEFDNPLTEYDVVLIDYNFRWFKDEELDRFLSNSIGIFNSYPPFSRNNLYTLEEKYIPHVMYGAAVDALRAMMLSLMFQEPQLVFGGPDAAKAAFGNFETLKKNYEGTWEKLLDNKKLQGYKGLTKMIIQPAFQLPAGRGRWFRYLFSGGSG